MNGVNKDCVCKNVTCNRHGKCEECREFHKENKTACQRAEEAQK